MLCKCQKMLFSRIILGNIAQQHLSLCQKITGFMFQKVEQHKLYTHFNIPLREPHSVSNIL